ncbi:SCO family protein [Nocardioides panacisoli]|uniref:SCO family protein n=1 Tax=Nocardioides panacisoli TaxID=627624 RepID=UPI001C639A31|nr:SCO family protein [Nocardioides panacisoli]QYJ04770.1 SCO family protein [Nocardioides panacisoli]
MRSLLARLSLLLVAALVAGCGADASSAEFNGVRLEQPYGVPDVPLTDTSGASYSLKEDREDALTIVFFGYTHCPDYCPLVMGSLSAAMNHLSEEDRERVNVTFVTTDPARDDEQALRDYLDGYGSEFVGLTGDLERVVELAEPLHIYVADGAELPSGGRDLGGHTTATLAIGEEDEAVALWKQDTSALEYAEDIHALLADD